jgi:aspartate aminotransferase
LDSITFARRLLESHNVAVVPGVAFGADSCVRLSYACTQETIETGLARFRAFCASLT